MEFARAARVRKEQAMYFAAIHTAPERRRSKKAAKLRRGAIASRRAVWRLLQRLGHGREDLDTSQKSREKHRRSPVMG